MALAPEQPQPQADEQEERNTCTNGTGDECDRHLTSTITRVRALVQDGRRDNGRVGNAAQRVLSLLRTSS